MQIADDGHHAARIEPVHEVQHARVDDGFGLRHGGLPQRVAFAHDGAQVVHGVEEYVGQTRDFGFDVTRHGQVDHEHRAVAALLDGALHGSQADDGQRAGGARNNDVELSELGRQFGQAHGAGVQALVRQRFGELLAAFQRAVGDHHLAWRLRGEVRGAQLDHLTGADEQYALIGDRFEDALRQAYSGSGHRHGMRADLCRAAHFLGHRKGALE